MQKKILILIGILLLIVNIAVAAATFSKDAFIKKINRMLDKAATYTSITNTERAEYLKAANIFADAFEKCINSGTDDMLVNEMFIKAVDEAWNSVEQDLNNPNYPAADKAQHIKRELKEKNFLQMGCHGGGLDISTNNKTSTGGNYSPTRKSYQCEVGQNIGGLCVYQLPSYNISLEAAKNRCSNFGMSFATRDQLKILSDQDSPVCNERSGELGSMCSNGYVSGMNTSGSYYTVLCIKDNRNTTSTGGNYSPAQTSYKCEVGQNLEGMCVIPETTYNVSDNVAKSRCSKYGMTFATKDQVNKLAKHADIIYKGYPGEAGSLFVFGIVSGMNFHGSYYTVLCVKDNNNIATADGNYSPIQKSYKCDVGQRLEGMCVIPETSYNVSDSVAKSRCSKYGMTFATKDQVNKLAKHADIIYKGYPGEAGSLFVFGIVSGMNTSGSYYTVLCVK